MQKKIKLGTRIMIGFSIIFAIVFVLVGVALYNMNIIHSKMYEMTVNQEKVRLVNIITQSTLLVSRNIRGNIAFANNPTIMEQEAKDLVEIRAKLDKAVQELEKLSTTNKEKAIIKSYIDSQSLGRPANNEVKALISAHKYNEAAQLLSEKAEKLMQDSIDKIGEVIVYADAKSLEENNTALQTYNISYGVLLTLTIICIIIGIMSIILITRSVTNPVNQIAGRLSEGAQQVAAASNQLSASAQQLSQGSAEQAAAIEETCHRLFKSPDRCYSKILPILNKQLNSPIKQRNPPIKAILRCKK